MHSGGGNGGNAVTWMYEGSPEQETQTPAAKSKSTLSTGFWWLPVKTRSGLGATPANPQGGQSARAWMPLPAVCL